jgi:hypothetical protein
MGNATMSVVVMGLVYRARLGSQTRKSVALALADHAEDDGTSAHPTPDYDVGQELRHRKQMRAVAVHG